MSEYIVATPFTMGSCRLSRGQRVGAEIEGKRNFRSLLEDRYIVPFYNKKTNEPFVAGCYMVVKSFKKGKIRFSPGNFVDTRDGSLRNEGTLLSSGYIRRATEDDVARHSAHSPLSGTPGNKLSGAAGKVRLWNNPMWVRAQYVDEGKSIPEMCRIAGCSTSTMWTAIKSLKIETRPRGRPASK